MSALFSILGRAITVETSEIIWHWFDIAPQAVTALRAPEKQSLQTSIDLARQDLTTQARDILRLYLFENPSCVLGRMAAGALCLKMNNPTEAIAEFTSVYTRQPSNTMSLYALGHCFERTGQESQAVEYYQDCLKFKSFLQLPRQRLAAIYLKKGRLDDAIHEYEQLRSEYPEDIQTLVALGHMYIKARKYNKAIDTFNTAILIHPDNYTDQDNELNELIQQGHLDDALERLDEKLEDNPDQPDLILKQADVLSMLGASSEATEHYVRALRMCPDLIEATIKLGTMYLQQQNDQMAAMSFNRAYELNDRVLEAYIGLAAAQILSGQEDKAKATLSLAAAIAPNSSLLFAQTAALLFNVNMPSYSDVFSEEENSNNLNHVIEAHKQQLSSEPHNPDLHYRLGLLAMSVGDIQQACLAFRNSVSLNGSFERARTKLIVCLYESNQIKEAVEVLKNTNQYSLDSLDLHYKVSLLYCDKPRFASSLINLEHFMEKNFADTIATHDISIVLQNMGLVDRSQVTWDSLGVTAQKNADENDPLGPHNAF